MAGWIKWQKGLTRKPEVLQIAAALNVTTQHAAACCMLVWEWTDEVTTEGLIRLPPEAIDRITGQPGFASAMEDAGWLIASDSAIQFPNYDRHNGNCTKARMLDAARKKSARMAHAKHIRP